MSRAMQKLLGQTPAPSDTEALWTEAIVESRSAPTFRSADGGTPTDRIRSLKEKIDKELVAFHDRLVVDAHQGDPAPRPGTKLWDVAIPLTLFPKRDRGFSRLECIVELGLDDGDTGAIRVVSLQPEERTKVLAKAEMGAKLELKAKAGTGVEAPLPEGTAVAEAAAEVYGKAEAGAFEYKAERDCVQSEIVAGTGARWRLDDVHDPQQVGLEGHRLGLLLEVENGTGPIHAAGYLQAYSDTKWLTMTLGAFWREFKKGLRSFFKRGLPVEAYGEWEDILG